MQTGGDGTVKHYFLVEEAAREMMMQSISGETMWGPDHCSHADVWPSRLRFVFA